MKLSEDGSDAEDKESEIDKVSVSTEEEGGRMRPVNADLKT